MTASMWISIGQSVLCFALGYVTCALTSMNRDDKP